MCMCVCVHALTPMPAHAHAHAHTHAGVSIHAEEGSVHRFDNIPYSHKVYVVLPYT
jgi:hypothetical protein